MPAINFKFKLVSISDIHRKRKAKNTIVEKNITGIVILDKDGVFYVLCGEDIYPITQESYNCRGKDIVFNFTIHKNTIVRIDRSSESVLTNLPPTFTPFAPGCIVYGDIIMQNYKKHFNITKVDWDARTEENVPIRQNFIECFKLYKAARYECLGLKSKKQ